ncbi:PQQ-binding-like beta-propeller repeat protein [Streptomyces sp. NPDC017979]|uniref:protein kinase domain-containing protein n=1 Tax=Streptomyces sp. NPDC017979 TaxID=3365024 RepID=UPI00379AB4AF
MPPLRSAGGYPGGGQPESESGPAYAGQYQLESWLGTGGMGVVHLATSASGLRLAVKVIHAEHATDSEFRARFRQEVAAARRVSGAFTAPVVDADPDAERPWMATLFIDGPTLAERVKRNGPLDVDEVRRAGAGLAEALRDIHRAGVVHRDLKPSNVLLAADGPKVIDFGISRPADSDLRTETGKLIGTPPFMAPEQFQRPREVGPEADVFAMGSVLVHALTGRGPFDSDSPYVVAYQVVHDEPDLTGVPPGLVPLISRCLAKDPARRPTPNEVMAELREAASPSSGYDTQAYVPLPRTPDPRERAPELPVRDRKRDRMRARLSGRRRRAVVAGAAAVVIAVVSGVVVAQVAGDEDGPRGTRGVGSAAKAPSAWDVRLGDGPGDERTPACTSAPEGAALYCAAPGIAAARLDPATGRRTWTREGADDGGASSVGPRPPVVAGGLVHVRSSGGRRTEALDPANGHVRWSASTAAYSSVRHVGDVVLLGKDDGRVRALDARTGRELWQGRHGGTGTEWAGAGAVGYAVTAPLANGSTSEVTAVDLATGAVRWAKRVAGALRPVGVSGDALYLHAVDAAGDTKEVVRVPGASAPPARTRLPAPVPQAQATVAGDVVYLSGAGGSLVAVRGGAQLWRTETGATQLSRPTAGGAAVYVSAGDGRLLAVDAVRGSYAGQTDPRMDAGENTYASYLPAPVLTGTGVVSGAPSGAVFGVPQDAPARW